MFKLCVLTRWDFNFCVRSSPLRGTWQELKQQLTLRFAEVTDEQHAFALLQRVRQERDACVPLFAVRLQTLANEAFPEGQGGPVQRQLVGFFIDGLAHNYLKMKVMRENPVEFERAVGIATEEQNLRQKFALRTRFRSDADRPMHHRVRRHAPHEPMEVDHSRGRGCYHCGGNHKARECRKGIMEVQKQRQDRVQCWRCHGYVHIQRNCRAPVARQANRQ